MMGTVSFGSNSTELAETTHPFHVRSTPDTDHKFNSSVPVAVCHCSKSLRDSPLRGRLTASVVPSGEMVGGGRGALS